MHRLVLVIANTQLKIEEKERERKKKNKTTQEINIDLDTIMGKNMPVVFCYFVGLLFGGLFVLKEMKKLVFKETLKLLFSVQSNNNEWQDQRSLTSSVALVMESITMSYLYIGGIDWI